MSKEWKAEREKNHFVIVEGGHTAFATVVGLGMKDAEERARLIAAAPEMLEALKEIEAWIPSAAPDEPGGMSIMDAIDISRAAIAKAKG